MQVTELHLGNLLVDADWNITALIDLEWICARSPQMIDVPYWIASRSIDEVCSSRYLREYTEAREEFMAQFVKEEQENTAEGPMFSSPSSFHSRSLSEVIRHAFTSKATWFFPRPGFGQRHAPHLRGAASAAVHRLVSSRRGGRLLCAILAAGFEGGCPEEAT